MRSARPVDDEFGSGRRYTRFAMQDGVLTWCGNGRRGAPSSIGIDGIERRWFCPLVGDRPQQSV
jgi:hypothetical protein